MGRLDHYSAQSIDESDERSVLEVLRSDFLTTGPKVREFEEALEKYTGARHVIAVANGTCALHLALLAAGVGPGDEVILPTLTFVATANAVLAVGAVPRFVDIGADLQMDPALMKEPGFYLPVHYAGAAKSYLSDGIVLVDGAHALGAEL